MYAVRKCSNFILLHVAVQFSQNHLLKRLFLPHLYILATFVKISTYRCMGLFLGFLSSFIGLYFCLCDISDQIRSVTQSCQTLCGPMNRSTPGLQVHHQLLEFTQTHVHRVSDAIQPSHPLLSPSPLAPNPSQHQSLFQ